MLPLTYGIRVAVELMLLLNVAAHNVSIKNVTVSKREHHITYSIPKCTASQNLSAHYVIVTKHFVTVYIL